jgi:MerR-like DNA binding protein
MGSGRGNQRFRVSEVAEILGTNPRQIEGWVEQGFLKPAVQGSGPGRPSYFDCTNLLQGVLTLEFQRTFGAKTPVWGRVAGSVAKALAEKEAKLTGSSLNRLIMLVSYQEEKPAIIQMTSMDRMNVSIRRELNQGRTVVILGLEGVVKALYERLAVLESRSVL